MDALANAVATQGVTEALSKKDYEKAVGFVTRYFETEQQLKNVGEIADLTSSAHSVQMQAVCCIVGVVLRGANCPNLLKIIAIFLGVHYAP